MDVIYVIYIMKYYENMNGSEKYQVKGNSSCRRECEEEKNGIKEELFIISIIFFLLKISSKIESKTSSLTKLSVGTWMFVIFYTFWYA